MPAAAVVAAPMVRTPPTMVEAALAALLVLASTPSIRAGEFTAQHLFVCSEGSHLVIELNASGALVRTLGEGTGLAAPAGLAFDAQGVLWVASSGSDRVLGFAANGSVVAELGAGSGLLAPRGIAIGPTGNVFTGDLGTGTIFEFHPDGTLVGSLGAGAGLVVPSDLAFGADGHLFVTSAGTGRVTEFDAAGAVVRELGADSSLILAISLCFGADGMLFVSSGSGESVIALGASGAELAMLGPAAELDATAGVAMGPDGLLHVVSRDSGVVSVLDASGELVRQLGAGTGIVLGGDLAFAPARFPVTLTGHMQGNDAPETKLKQPAVLSVMPGSLALGLAFADDTGFAALVGSRSLMLRGFQSASDAPGALVLQAAMSHGKGTGAKQAQLLLNTSGKTTSEGAYLPVKIKGDLWGGGPAGQARASLKVGKQLP